jgi:hypothetical protein
LSRLRSWGFVFCVAALALVLGGATPALAWGPIAHQAVTAKAIGTLPKGLEPFYKAHRLELPTLAPDAQASEEGQERRFAADAFVPFPFADLPRTEAAAKQHYPDNPALAGRLPWLIQESYAKLVEDFKKKDREAILKESDILAALVTDLHNPLALTANFDGQKSEQNGLWVRFSIKFPEVMEKKLHLNADAARFLDNPQEFMVSMIKANYIWLDNLLYADELARRGKGVYGEIYYESLDIRAGDILKSCLSRAAEDAGSFWYTAWTAAGRPEMK